MVGFGEFICTHWYKYWQNCPAVWDLGGGLADVLDVVVHVRVGGDDDAFSTEIRDQEMSKSWSCELVQKNHEIVK